MEANKSHLLLSKLKLFIKSFLEEHHLANPSLLVAYSGGLDSTVLLHALFQLQSEIPFHLTAMHVHHGLSANADDWARFCSQTCDDLGVTIQQAQVKIDQSSGLGVEATARKARYQALESAEADFICLAHHQDDQAETLLLQLARGAGVKGLAGMTTVDIKRSLLRPFLDTPRSELLTYAKQHHLQWIEDESNDDTRFDRNFIRQALMPTFRQRYTSISKTLARSASHMAEANTLLDELATLDAAQVLDAQYQTLSVEELTTLSPARQNNLVRFWLVNNQVTLPQAAVLAQVVTQLQSAKADATVKIKVAEQLHVMRYQHFAYLVPETASLPPINLLWQGDEEVVLPNFSRLIFSKKMGEGFAYQRGGTDIKLRIKNREGGEYFKPDLSRPRRQLKTIMQSSAIPPWQRSQLPLIFMDETLVIIPNIGCDATLAAESHELGLTVHWQPYVE